MTRKRDNDPERTIRGAAILLGLLAGAVVFTVIMFSRASLQTQRTVHTILWAGGSVAGAAVLVRVGLSIYDALYQRALDREHDRIDLAERRQGLETERIRVLYPDEHGRQGIAYDGRTFRDLDSRAAFDMLENRFLHPMLEQMNHQQKMLAALAGVQIQLKGSDLAQLAANAAPEQTAIDWPTRVPLRGLLANGAPSFRSLVLGVTMDAAGAPEVIRADMGALVHMAVGGSSGWGKSVFLRALAYQLAQSADPVDLAMVDLEGATLAPFATSDRLLWPIADSETDAGAILRELTGELDRRKAAFARYPGVDSLSAYNDRAADPLAPIVAIVDEATALLENKEIEGALRTLALRARKFGLWLVLAGQDWKASSLDSAIRNQLSTRVQFRAMSATQSRVLLEQSGAEDLAAKGRALAWLPGRELVELQAPIVSADEIAGAMGGNGPRAALPSETRTEQERIRELAAQGHSRRQIALAVFGYAGGAAFRKVSEALGDTTVPGTDDTLEGRDFEKSATVVPRAKVAPGECVNTHQARGA